LAWNTLVFDHGVLCLDVEVESVTLSATLFVDVCSTALEMAVILFEASLVFARLSVSILKWLARFVSFTEFGTLLDCFHWVLFDVLAWDASIFNVLPPVVAIVGPIGFDVEV
jgi:hypothetical protein